MPPRRRSGRRRRPSRPEPPVPFILAAARPAAAGSHPALRRQARLARLVAAWEGLRPLEEAAWRGTLPPRGLARLQRARVAYARLFAEARP